MSFDPTKYLIKQQGKDYLPVPARVAWMRSEHPEWSILTEEIEVDTQGGYARMRATIMNDAGRIIAMATKTCTHQQFKFGFIEKAETGSVGRALAMCGYGTLNCDDLDEGEDERGQAFLGDSPLQAPQRPVQRPHALVRPSPQPPVNNAAEGQTTGDANQELAKYNTKLKELQVALREKGYVTKNKGEVIAMCDWLLEKPFSDDDPLLQEIEVAIKRVNTGYKPSGAPPNFTQVPRGAG